MIRISCSKLETVRENPKTHAQLLASKKETGRGSHGMFACWQDVVRNIHKAGTPLTKAIQHLQQTFSSKFSTTLANNTKQRFLLNALPSYFKQFEKERFGFIETRRNINWPIISDVLLTGHTPTVARADNQFYAYYNTEEKIDWQSQLRFPLIQAYLAEQHLYTLASKINVGIYCLKTNQFEFKVFSDKEIESAIHETQEVFKTVIDEFNK